MILRFTLNVLMPVNFVQLLALASVALVVLQTRPSLTYDHGGITRGPVGEKRLSLIFTGGDFGEGMDPILTTLGEHQIKAAFFLTGDFLRNPAHAGTLRRAVAEGHGVYPHSDKHLLYCDWKDRKKTLVTESAFKEDLKKNIADLKELGALREGPIYFVPPYEWYNEDQVRWARELGVTLINFTPGSGSNRDYIPEGEPKFTPSAKIREDILAYEKKDPRGLNGFLLLLHVGSKRQDKMHTELDPLIRELKARGYTFASVDEQLK